MTNGTHVIWRATNGRGLTPLSLAMREEEA